jgi:hypothetical protein
VYEKVKTQVREVPKVKDKLSIKEEKRKSKASRGIQRWRNKGKEAN